MVPPQITFPTESLCDNSRAWFMARMSAMLMPPMKNRMTLSWSCGAGTFCFSPKRPRPVLIMFLQRGTADQTAQKAQSCRVHPSFIALRPFTSEEWVRKSEVGRMHLREAEWCCKPGMTCVPAIAEARENMRGWLALLSGELVTSWGGSDRRCALTLSSFANKSSTCTSLSDQSFVAAMPSC